MALVHTQPAWTFLGQKAIKIVTVVRIQKPAIPYDDINSDWLCDIYWCDPDIDQFPLDLDPEVKSEKATVWIREWSDTSITPGVYHQIPMESRDSRPIFVRE